MVRLSVALAVVLLVGQAARSQEKSIVDFYPHADSVCQFPPIGKDLVIVCQKKLSRRYVTFVGLQGERRVLLAAVTVKPLPDPRKSISLSVNFEGINPTAGKISTWGYVYDRNRDGAIDYLALVGGAAAYKPPDFYETTPERSQAMTEDQADYYVGHCRIVFNHWADDNNDGVLDAAIQIDMDPDRDWVDHQIVVRSTNFDGEFDDVWGFRWEMGVDRDSVDHSLTSVPYHPIGKPKAAIIDAAAFNERTGILRLLNQAAKECGLTRENFYPEPPE
jgi:hypothetical protein